MNFTVICRVSTFVDRYLVQQGLRRYTRSRFRREGIEMSYPGRNVHLYAHNTLLPQDIRAWAAQVRGAGWKASWAFPRAACLRVEGKQTTPGR
jgi:small-conductance mechanosensitive channel